MRYLLFVSFVFNSMLSFATIEKVEIDGVMFNIDTTSSTAELTYFGNHWLFLEKPYSGSFIIPEKVEYEGKFYEITSIGEGAFYSCVELTSITIPSTVTKIKDYALSGCLNLKKIQLPDKLSEIGSECFNGCVALNELIIPNSVKSIGESAFCSCSSLSVITIPESVVSIGHSAFKYCTGLKSVKLNKGLSTLNKDLFYNCSELKTIDVPEGVSTIGDNAFYGCAKLVEISLPVGVSYIGDAVFANCSNIQNVTIPNSVTHLGNYVFLRCNKLNSIQLPEGVDTIGNYAFRSCFALSSISIPSSVRHIGSYAFGGCEALTSIKIPDGVASIGNHAFFECVGISNLIIPESLSNIGTNAFEGCRLESILTKNPRTKCKDSFSERTYLHAMLYTPSGSWGKAVYEGDWYLFRNIREIAIEKNAVSSTRTYTIMDSRSFNYLICDDTNSNLVTVDSFYNIDESNPYHCWRVINDKGNTLLVNVGTKRYLSISEGGNLYLSEEAKALELSDQPDGISFNGIQKKYFSFVENSNSINTNIHFIEDMELPKDYYTIGGMPTNSRQKGVLIIKDNKGVTRKILNP